MTEVDIFRWLVEYHAQVNLEYCQPYMVDGKLCDDRKNPMVEGSDKRSPYEGILILKNGNTLIDKLKKDGRVHKDDVDEAISVKTKEEFFKFMSTRTEEDGVFVYESTKKQLRRVSYVRPQTMEEKVNGGALENMIENNIPNDFIKFNSTLNPTYLRLKLGTKTRLAIELTQVYCDIEAFQIKRSAYAELGMGKVTHFNRQGLVEEFFLMSEADTSNHSEINDYAVSNSGKDCKTNSICGVYRSYVKEDGKVKLAEEKKVYDLESVSEVRHKDMREEDMKGIYNPQSLVASYVMS